MSGPPRHRSDPPSPGSAERGSWSAYLLILTLTNALACSAAAAALEIQKLTLAATLAQTLHLRVNAGHGLNYQNTSGIRAVPHLETLNIGHSIISRALFVGLPSAVREMLALLHP